MIISPEIKIVPSNGGLSKSILLKVYRIFDSFPSFTPIDSSKTAEPVAPLNQIKIILSPSIITFIEFSVLETLPDQPTKYEPSLDVAIKVILVWLE